MVVLLFVVGIYNYVGKIESLCVAVRRLAGQSAFGVAYPAHIHLSAETFGQCALKHHPLAALGAVSHVNRAEVGVVYAVGRVLHLLYLVHAGVVESRQ